MPLLVVLKSLNPLLVIDSLGFANLGQHILDSGHHALQSAKVHVRSVLQLIEDLVGVLLDLVLNVHLSSLLVVLLAGQGVIESEVIGEAGLGILEFVVVEEGVGVGHSQEEPGLSLVDARGGGVLEEETADESAEGGDAGSGGHHDVIGIGIFLGHEHDLSGGSGHGHLVAGGAVAEEVGADSLLGGILGLEFGTPVGGAADAETSRLSGHVIAVAGGGDGVEAHGVGLAVLLAHAGGDDAPGLSLDVGEISVVVDDDVAGLSGGLGSDDALGGDDLSGEGGLVFVGVDLEFGNVVVGGEFEEVLLQAEGGPDVRRCDGFGNVNVWGECNDEELCDSSTATTLQAESRRRRVVGNNTKK